MTNWSGIVAAEIGIVTGLTATYPTTPHDASVARAPIDHHGSVCRPDS